MLRFVVSPSILMSNTLIAHWCPIRCSVTHTTCLSSSLNETLFTAVGNSQVYSNFPLDTFHSFILLSAEPDTKNCVFAEDGINWRFAQDNMRPDSQSTSTVHTVPLCPLNVPNRSPFAEYQTLMIWSFEQEKMRSPCALYLIWVRERSCPIHQSSD